MQKLMAIISQPNAQLGVGTYQCDILLENINTTKGIRHNDQLPELGTLSYRQLLIEHKCLPIRLNMDISLTLITLIRLVIWNICHTMNMTDSIQALCGIYV